MSITLPDPIAAFFRASNFYELPFPGDCFTDDAVVRDEGHLYQGRHAIQLWLAETQRRYMYSVEPLTSEGDGVCLRVQAKLAGAFPGSPLQITYSFTLINNKISLLEII